MKNLFIGGHKDGQWFEVKPDEFSDDMRPVRVVEFLKPVERRLPKVLAGGHLARPEALQVERYERIKVNSQGRFAGYAFVISDRLDDHDFINHELQKYFDQ